MKKLLKLSMCIGASLLFHHAVEAQPLHQPIPAYTNDGSCARVGHGSTFLTTGTGGYMQRSMGGIEVDGNIHYLVQNVGQTDGRSIIVDKKNGTTGATIATSRFDIAQTLGISSGSTDYAWDTEIDANLQQLYIVGESNAAGYGGWVMCVDLTTMMPKWSFGTNGIISLGSKISKGSGVTLTGIGNNFVVSAQSGSGIRLLEYTSLGFPVMNNLFTIPTMSIEATNATLKRAPNGHFFLAGWAKDGSSVDHPMIWDFRRTAGAYLMVNSNSPYGPLGAGQFLDYDFWVDPTPANPGNYAFDIVAVGSTGNLGSGQGIYAKYVIPNTTTSFYAPITSFTNQTSIPGTAQATNDAATDIVFTRCVANDDGYTTIMGYYTSSNSARLLTGYITPSGSSFTRTYQAPGAGSCERIHKSTGMIEDNDGNILVSGCATATSYTIIKLSNTYDCMPDLSLHGSTSEICTGQEGYLNINTASGNEIVVSVLGGKSFYHGYDPISLIVTPTQTTTYVIDVYDPVTGCHVSLQHTIVVNTNNPAFSMSINTSNPSYMTLSAIANDQSANSQPGFGYAWVVEELNSSGTPIFTFYNPSCWWQPLSSANVFNGIDCISYSYIGSQTISNCLVPSMGKFEYGKKYRITRGTWNDDCPWNQTSMIVQVFGKKSGRREVVQVEDPNAPDMSFLSRASTLEEMLPSLEVYPNPNNGSFQVSSAHGFDTDVRVLDMTGKEVLTIAKPQGNYTSVDLTRLTKGVYFVKTAVNGQMITEKVIVQ